MIEGTRHELSRSGDARPSPALLSRKHQAAILDAEARRLARTLERYGTLTRHQLEELCGARRWTRGRFSRALEIAQERGLIRHLGLDFYGHVADLDGPPEQPTDRHRGSQAAPDANACA